MTSQVNNNSNTLNLLPDDLRKVLGVLGFHTLTPIQEQSIPPLLRGEDIIAQSKTGSGKTAAFSLPLLTKINLRDRRVQVMILCPTRELCTQVASEIRRLGRRHPGLHVMICSGGQPARPQRIALENGVHIVVGTPGRVLDHVERRSLDLRSLRTLVLDEADRMLDMGFEEEMSEILRACPKARQTMLFSATFPDEIEQISAKFQKTPVRITIEDPTDAKVDIVQIAYETPHDDKQMTLRSLLEQEHPEACIIFCNHKGTAKELADDLCKTGMSAAALHGDLEQIDRDRVMARFRNRSVRALVATDVAARGIDIADLDIVFNYDMPLKTETYVHRIGRTGRAGKSGLALSLYTPREVFKLDDIEATQNFVIERRKSSGVARPASNQANKKQLAKMMTLRIGAGRKDKLRAGDVLGALTGEAGGLKASQVGKIEIQDRVSFVAVESQVAQDALRGMQRGKIKGRSLFVELIH